MTSSIALGGTSFPLAGCKLPSLEKPRAGARPRGSGLPEESQHHTQFGKHLPFLEDLNPKTTAVMLLTGDGSHPLISCSPVISDPMEKWHQ